VAQREGGGRMERFTPKMKGDPQLDGVLRPRGQPFEAANLDAT